MTTLEWLCVVLAAFCVGVAVGAINEAYYWVDHALHGGAVHHNGKFYRVMPEKRANDLERHALFSGILERDSES